MKIFTIFLIILTFIFISWQITFASLPNVITTNKTIFDLVNKALSWFTYFVIIVAIIMILYVAFLYISSGGDKNKLHTAFNALIYIIIGLVVLLLTETLINLIHNFVTSSENTNEANSVSITIPPDELNNITFDKDQLLQQSYYQYLDEKCALTDRLDCCKCCKQGGQNDQCGRATSFAI